MRNKAVLALAALAIFVAGPIHAQTGAGLGYSNDQPIQIKSDRLEGDDSRGLVTFLGNVMATQGPISIYAEKLIIVYTPKGREIDRVEAEQGVRIVQGDRVATGQKAVFYNREGKVVLTGSPRVNDGADFVEGEEITVFLNEEKSIVKGGGSSRVNAIFHPQGKKP
ncbi:hypothetical protein DESUT3_25590 [Desulfuromonas versatilis]|uniref:Organic solvent tolerance-like N-terminal domain-containing protein n=1 Tax=Desulfuromonas versatilis TaxID=2802975 RepID=A0ABM8HY30_9BACT|nr:lipopolysaccharide transport periplasmic protein LptA [Desulfuromonas versatilis]BCR05490.1 hypothetical protein DESUT3_25590 [Desulfuromonas versatilis]